MKEASASHNFSLRTKINLAIAGVFFLMAIAYVAVLVPLHRTHMEYSEEQTRLYLDMLVKREGEHLANDLFGKRLRALELRVRQVLALERMLSITVYDARGNVVEHCDRMGEEQPIVSSGWLDDSHGRRTARSEWHGIPALTYQAPVMVMGEAIGHVRLVYSMSGAVREKRLFYFSFTVLLLATTITILVVLQRFLHRRVTQPITRLRDAMEKHASSGSIPQLVVESGDEIGSLMDAFNKMAVRIEQAMASLQVEVAERKQAEEESRRLRNDLSDIINSMPSALVGVDSEGRVTHWNRLVAEETGLGEERAIGEKLGDVFPLLAEEIPVIREAIARGRAQRTIRRPAVCDGRKRHLDMTVYPLVASRAGGAVIRLDDVTERVRMQEVMLQSEKMLSVGGLAAGMAHEINNPLGGIMQTASVMTDRMTNLSLPANLRAAEEAGTTVQAIRSFMESRGIIRMLARIRESGNRAAEIVSNMLSFARKGDLEAAPHDLAQLMDQCVDLAGSDYNLKKRFDFRQIEIVREYDTDMPLVPCEPGKIQQVLLNLLRNGAEAMWEARNGTEERVPRFVLRITHEREVGMARVEVEDNGPGMDETTRKRIFEPFFTTKPPDSGTGLGLSVSYFIITENHGGEMRVDSEPGKGSRFTIRLPMGRRDNG